MFSICKCSALVLCGDFSVLAGSLPSTGIAFQVVLGKRGKPLSGVTLDGVAMTGRSAYDDWYQVQCISACFCGC